MNNTLTGAQKGNQNAVVYYHRGTYNESSTSKNGVDVAKHAFITTVLCRTTKMNEICIAVVPDIVFL